MAECYNVWHITGAVIMGMTVGAFVDWLASRGAHKELEARIDAIGEIIDRIEEVE